MLGTGLLRRDPGFATEPPDWARDLRDQCHDTGAALFLKQMWKRQAIPADLKVREYPAA
jgi:hypothetical protein